MKLFFILLLTLSIASCGIFGNKAVDYNNSLVEKQYEVSEDMNAFMDFIKVNRQDSIKDILAYKTELNSLRKVALDKIEESQKAINEIGAFEGEIGFKNSLLEMMNAYYKGIDHDYYQMGIYYLLPKEEQTIEKYNETVELVLEMDSKVEAAEHNFIEEQKIFGKRHNVALNQD